MGKKMNNYKNLNHRSMKQLLVFILLFSSTLAKSQNIEGKLANGGDYGSNPNSDLAVTLRATSQYPIGSAASPTIFVLRIEQSEWNASGVTSVSIIDNPLDMGDGGAPDAEWDDSNGYHYLYYSAGVADWDLSDCSTTLNNTSTYLSLVFNDMNNSFVVEMTLKDVDPVVGSEVNLVDDNQLILVDDIVMPLELIDFTAQNHKTYSSLLKWATTNEVNVDKYEIERSQDTENWEAIGYVKAKDTNYTTNYYSYIDKDVYDGYGENTFFYRLKMIDYNTQYKLSKVRSVQFFSNSRKLKIQVFPNPSSKVVYYKLSGVRRNSNLNIKVYDNTGQLILEKTKKYNTKKNLLLDKNSFNMDNGVYNLIITDENDIKYYSNFILTR